MVVIKARTINKITGITMASRCRLPRVFIKEDFSAPVLPIRAHTGQAKFRAGNSISVWTGTGESIQIVAIIIESRKNMVFRHRETWN
jgi:hypothetical protein